jgi:hypothetical protein
VLVVARSHWFWLALAATVAGWSHLLAGLGAVGVVAWRLANPLSEGERLRLSAALLIGLLPFGVGVLSLLGQPTTWSQEGLAELGIADPTGSLATTLARYSREAIVYGLAVFRTKKEQNTLPPGADYRYLAGIIRNDHEKRHLLQFSEHLFRQRVRLRDFSLSPLERLAERIRATKALPERPQSFVSLALKAEFEIDFRYWTRAAFDALAALPWEQRPALYHHLCRLIAASFRTQKERRETLVDRLADAATVLAA